MSAEKRRRDDEECQLQDNKEPRIGDLQQASDQQSPDPRTVFSATFEPFQMFVRLRSASKASQNDPRPRLTVTELKPEVEGGLQSVSPQHESVPGMVTRSVPSIPDAQSDSNHRQGRPDDMADAHLDPTHPQPTDVAENKPEELSSQLSIEVDDGSDRDEQYEVEDDEGLDTIGEGSDEDLSEYEPDFEFKWLENVDVKVTSTAELDEQGKPKLVGYCEARLIRRSQIRHEFYSEMEQPADQTCWLAFDLFDRYGRPRPEFMTHPVIKGNGVWGNELNEGDMLLVEHIYVERSRRRQHLGQKMIQVLLQITRKKTRSFFAFALPSLLNLHDIRKELEALQDEAAEAQMQERELHRATAFFRAQNFRRVGNSNWFAMAPNEQHMSRQLKSTQDSDPTGSLSASTLHPTLEPFRQITERTPLSHEEALMQHIDPQQRKQPDFLGALQECFKQQGSSDVCWMGTDRCGNNILHLSVKIMDSTCVEWVLQQPFGPQLLPLCNNRGVTPLESLQFHLERLRTQGPGSLGPRCCSDKFAGHSRDGLRCLVLLKGFPDLDTFAKAKGMSALQQLTTGCTCGRCIQGVLSPRMSYALHLQAELGHDWLADFLDQDSGPDWVDLMADSLEFLPSRLRNNLGTNKSVRTGFCNLWKHIATCLEQKKLPNTTNVLEVVQDASEWPPHTRNFLNQGGIVEHAFLPICQASMVADELIGDGFLMGSFKDEYESMPECRNDREFGFVSGMCGFRPISLISRQDMRGNVLDEYGNVVDSLR